MTRKGVSHYSFVQIGDIDEISAEHVSMFIMI